MRGLHHVVKKIVAYDRPINFLSEQVHDQHITRLQHIDRSLILQATDAVVFSFAFGNPIHVLAQRHELNRECTPNHGLAGMQYLKSVRVLVIEMLLLQDLPHFFRRQFTGALNQIVRHLRPAIGKAIEWIPRRVVSQLLLGKGEQLRRSRWNEAKQSRHAKSNHKKRDIEHSSSLQCVSPCMGVKARPQLTIWCSCLATVIFNSEVCFSVQQECCRSKVNIRTEASFPCSPL